MTGQEITQVEMEIDGKVVLEYDLWKDGAGGWMLDVAVFADGTAATDEQLRRLEEEYEERLSEEWDGREYE